MLLLSPFLFFLLLGTVLVVTELMVFNLSVFWFLFIGIGAFIATFVAWLFPTASWLEVTMVFLLASVSTTLVLYRPLRRCQRTKNTMPGNDAIGQKVTTYHTIVPGKMGEVMWSGSTWNAYVATDSHTIKPGDSAYIIGISGITLTIHHHPPSIVGSR
jgi:membrane protein implicated in regulation of membrane protease activity